MVCVGLRRYIGIPQDSYPELTERKKVMKDMTEKEKRSVLEYVFSHRQHEVNKKDEVADLETDNNSDDNSSSATDIRLDETKTTNQSSKKQRVLSDDVGESAILGSITFVQGNKKEGNSEASVDTKSTRSLNVADSKEEDVDLDEVVCSICLDSFGADEKVENDSDGVLYAPN